MSAQRGQSIPLRLQPALKLLAIYAICHFAYKFSDHLKSIVAVWTWRKIFSSSEQILSNGEEGLDVVHTHFLLHLQPSSTNRRMAN